MDNHFFLLCALISGFVYFSGLISHLTKEKLGLSGALISTSFGLLVSHISKYSAFSKYFVSTQSHHMASTDSFMKELSRVVVSLQVVAVGMYVPKSYVLRERFSLFIILVPFMAVTFLISSVGAYYILDVNTKIALVIGACVTPTDPVLAATIMKGRFASKYIPVHIRNLLTIESGANDGLGSILLTLSILFGVQDWKKPVIKLFMIDIFLSLFLGGLIGFLSRKLQILCKRKGLIDKESFLGSMISMGFFVTALTALFESADILACFVAGMVFSWDPSFVEEIKESNLLEVIDMLVNHVFFIIFGYLFDFSTCSRSFLLYSLVVIFLRRLPLFVIFRRLVPQLKTTKEAVFAGYFGPVGVGAILFGYHGAHLLQIEKFPGNERLMPILQCVTLSSIVIHGLVGFVLTRIIGKEKGYDPDESEYDTPSNCLIDQTDSDSFTDHE